jgi:simple sugar transport system ATP-binding protein
MTAPVLELRAIAKRYEGNPVLKGVSLTAAAGEIHALVGENGAGKSTLMNILFGMPVIRETGGYEGEILLDGSPVRFESPQQAMGAGLGMVHQEFMLLPGFAVAENIKLNREPTRKGLISRVAGRKLETLDRARMGADTRAALDRVGLGIDEWALVAGLPVGHLQFVEIAREVDRSRARVVIFDEPTAVLTESEAHEMLRVMRELARSGLAILFITHRLDEIFEVASRITVLRDGEVVATLDPARTSAVHVAELMVGRPAKVAVPHVVQAHGADAPAPVLAVRDLRVAMPGERVDGVTLDLRRGEILGIGGLAGQGKTGIANGIMGLYPATGSVAVEGRPLALGDPRAAIRAGLAFVSEDRRGVGLLLDESIELNMVLTALEVQGRFLRRFPISGLRLANRKAVRAHAQSMIRRLDVRCTGPAQQVRRLSGGNQQKVCLARAMTQEPRMLLVSEPTRGIDVGAKARVLEVLTELNRAGVSLLITSSELVELRAICDRIAIVHAGRIAAILPPEAPDAAFGLAMAGEQDLAS